MQWNWGDLRKFVEANTQVQDDEPVIIATHDNSFVIKGIEHAPAVLNDAFVGGIWIETEPM